VDLTISDDARGLNGRPLALTARRRTRPAGGGKKVFDDSELDGVIAKILKLDAVER
jgi:hypothetical protein